MQGDYSTCPRCDSLKVCAIYNVKAVWGIYSATHQCGDCKHIYFSNNVPKPEEVKS